MKTNRSVWSEKTRMKENQKVVHSVAVLGGGLVD